MSDYIEYAKATSIDYYERIMERVVFLLGQQKITRQSTVDELLRTCEKEIERIENS